MTKIVLSGNIWRTLYAVNKGRFFRNIFHLTNIPFLPSSGCSDLKPETRGLKRLFSSNKEALDVENSLKMFSFLKPSRKEMSNLEHDLILQKNKCP